MEDIQESQSAAAKLGNLIREARRARGLTIAELADQIGRPREWLNRAELGYAEYGQQKPPSRSDLNALHGLLANEFSVGCDEFLAIGRSAEGEFKAFQRTSTPGLPRTGGKLTQAEIVIGEEAVVDAILDLINQQHSDAVLRNTGIRGQGSFIERTEYWKRYRQALGDFLAKNPNGVFKRIEYVANENYLGSAKESDSFLTGGRDLKDVHNAKVKFRKQNPLSLHLLIGQREAILALPRTSGQPGSNMALVVRDKLFVEALRLWFDEVLWEGHEQNQMVDFTRFDESFEEIKKMYGF